MPSNLPRVAGAAGRSKSYALAYRTSGRSVALRCLDLDGPGALAQGARGRIRHQRPARRSRLRAVAGPLGLERAAGRLARLLLTEGALDHDAGTPFAQRLEHAAPAAHLWGENLAWGSGEGARPDEIIQGWMNSPEHRGSCSTAASRRSASASTGTFGDLGSGSVYAADFAA